MIKRVRLILWIAVAVAAVILGGLLLRKPEPPRPAVTNLSRVDFGGPFTLTGGDGRPFSSASLAGKPYAIFFGFTHCPDVCPTTLARMVKLRRQAGGDDALNLLFVTVDPERDGPAEVGKYAELFDAPVTGLTGSPAQIEQVMKQFGIFSRKAPAEGGGDYGVDHTATVLLFDRAGKFSSTIAPEEPDQAALDKIRRLTA